MTRTRVGRPSLLAAIVACALTATSSAEQSDFARTEAELRGITQQMMNAVAPGDVAVWKRFLHDELIHVDENGIVRGKAELLAELKPLPPGLIGRIDVDRFRMALHGDTAVVAYEIQEQLDYHGQMLHGRFRTTDTWLRTASGWKLIGTQTSAVLKDPPPATLTNAQLCAYNGTYSLTDRITTTISCAGDGLDSQRTERPPVHYRAELLDVFFVPGEPRTRRIFEHDAQGQVTGFVDRREGEDIRWRRRAAQSTSP